MYKKHKRNKLLPVIVLQYILVITLGYVVLIINAPSANAATANMAARCASNKDEINITKQSNPKNILFPVSTDVSCKGQKIYDVIPGTPGSVALTLTCKGAENPYFAFASDAAADKLVGACEKGSDNPSVIKAGYTPASNTPSDTSNPDGNANGAPAASGDPAANGGKCANLKQCDLVSQYLKPLILFMTALVGIATTISIVIGGIQYASSADDPQKVSAAKNRIRNAIVALVTFIFLYALLNFLIPGGLL